jgi:hypothetical protein
MTRTVSLKPGRGGDEPEEEKKPQRGVKPKPARDTREKKITRL